MEIREIVKTIVHNHMNSSVPMDVDKKGLNNLEQKEESSKESPEGQEDSGSRTEDQAEELACTMKKADSCATLARVDKVAGSPKEKAKGKDNSKRMLQLWQSGSSQQ